MKLAICEMVGADFPLFAFSHCRDVVAAASRAGAFGMLGATSFAPEQLKVELDWIDANVGGKPYGIDLAIPENMAAKAETGLDTRALMLRIPERHYAFTNNLLR